VVVVLVALAQTILVLPAVTADQVSLHQLQDHQ
jgi:hypothetical protein